MKWVGDARRDVHERLPRARALAHRRARDGRGRQIPRDPLGRPRRPRRLRRRRSARSSRRRNITDHDGRRLPHPRDVRRARGSRTPTPRRSRRTAAPGGPTSPTPSSGWSTTPRTSTASIRSSCGAGISCRATRCPTRRRTRATYDSGDFEAVMDDALERADWTGFPRATAQPPSARASCAASASRPISKRAAAARRPRTRSRSSSTRTASMTLFAVTQSSGQGHETVFPADRRRDARHRRRRTSASTPGRPTADLVGNGTGGSRGALGTGSAFKRARREADRDRAAARGEEARRRRRTSCATAKAASTRATARSASSSSRARSPDRSRIRSTPTPKASSA